MSRTRKPVVDRIMARVVETEGGCWLWTGAVSSGYGNVGLGGQGLGTDRVHRVMYRELVGPIPEGMTIDHLCFQRLCCNPAHLEVVTRGENTRRAWAAGREDPQRKRREQTHCKRGHPLSGENLRVDTHGYRQCRTCARDRRRRT